VAITTSTGGRPTSAASPSSQSHEERADLLIRPEVGRKRPNGASGCSDRYREDLRESAQARY
jgi:hypothetical protein